jgi:hypothetical protein
MLSMKQNHTESKITNISKIEESLKMKKVLLNLNISCKLVYYHLLIRKGTGLEMKG